MDAEKLSGGRTSGAAKRGNTIVRRGGPWSPTVHVLLRHLADHGFREAPVPFGFDDHGNEIVSHLDGRTVGDMTPWPGWVYSEPALVQTGQWLRRLHDVTRSFVPPPNAIWFSGRPWSPGLIIGHHDAAPYNAVWKNRLVGFIDWDTAGPSSPELDLAFTALTWVPLDTVAAARSRGFHAIDDRYRRLHLLLNSYDYRGDRAAFGQTVARRARLNAGIIRGLAATGNPVYAALLGHAADLELAAADISALPTTFWCAPSE